jgi:biotin operon repressor
MLPLLGVYDIPIAIATWRPEGFRLWSPLAVCGVTEREIHLARDLRLLPYARGNSRGHHVGDRHRVQGEELSRLWDCSPRAVRETLSRLRAWGVLAWDPRPGRGRRSVLTHRASVYDSGESARPPSSIGRRPPSGSGEILDASPGIPGVPEKLTQARRHQGLTTARSACCTRSR